MENAIEERMVALAAERGADKSICPSEVAKAVGEARDVDWHGLMQPVRRTAVRLAEQGRIVILRKGKPVDPHDFRGVYRLTVPRQD